MNTTNIQETIITSTLSNVVDSTKKTGCRFASFVYTNQNHETSRYNVILGIKIESLYKSDLRTLENILPTTTGLQTVACQELINSIKNSLTQGIGNNDSYTLKGYYKPITDNGEVKLHKDEDGVTKIYIRGYVIKKTVITKGEYPIVKHNPKTVEKDKLRKSMKQNKFRTFSININQIHTIKTNGITLEID